MHLDCTISISDIIVAVITAIPACLMAVFAFWQYCINKRQEKHQHTTTSIDYCKQLMEFFDACESDWKNIEEEYQKEIRETFDKAVKEYSGKSTQLERLRSMAIQPHPRT